jgi:hypothetical protein
MKVSLEKVYQCEHCGKKTRSASSTSRHEKFCRLNPVNEHICFQYCIHLKKEIRTIYDDGEPSYWETDMICTAKNNLKMYSYLIEKKLNFDKRWIKGLERMPLDCDKFVSMTYHEIDEQHR